MKCFFLLRLLCLVSLAGVVGCNSVHRPEAGTSVEGGKGKKSEKTMAAGVEKLAFVPEKPSSKTVATKAVTAIDTMTVASTAGEVHYHLPHASPQVEALIKRYAKAYEVPERLVRRVVRRESHGNPAARNGPYWGLMQISYPTAMSMGYKGKPAGLLDAETNLRYAVKYLAGAYMVAGGNEAQAVRLYARGFYYDAKAKGLLERTGLRPGPSSIVTAFVNE